MHNSHSHGRRVPVAAGLALLALAVATPASAQSLASYGATPGQVAAGAALDAAGNTAAATTIANSIRALPDAYARADALGQLSAASFTLLPTLAIQSLDAVDAQIHNHLADRRDQDAHLNKPDFGKLRVALMGDLRQAHYNTRPDRPYATSDSRSLSAAIDYKPSAGVVIGASIGVDGMDSQLGETPPRISFMSYHIGPYASVTAGRAWIEGNMDYASANYKLFREVGFGSLDNRMTINGSRSDDSWGASLATGYRLLNAGPVAIEPFAGLHYRYAHTPEFREAGGAAALDVASYKAESLRSALGGRASTTIVRGDWTLQPSVSAEWRHELRGDVTSPIEARFVYAGGPVFTLNPDQPGRNAGIYSAGLSTTWRDRTILRLSYRGEFANDRRINGFMATLSRRV